MPAGCHDNKTIRRPTSSLGDAIKRDVAAPCRFKLVHVFDIEGLGSDDTSPGPGDRRVGPRPGAKADDSPYGSIVMRRVYAL